MAIDLEKETKVVTDDAEAPQKSTEQFGLFKIALKKQVFTYFNIQSDFDADSNALGQKKVINAINIVGKNNYFIDRVVIGV